MKALILALALASAATGGAAQTAPALPPAAAPSYGPPVSLEVAQDLIDRTMAHGAANGWRLAVAVVEPSGALVAFGRMDDTQYGSIHVAQRKAETSARYRLATAALEERVVAGRLVILANEDTLPFPGGRPIVIDGRIVGAIGVSGATSAQDDEAALAALATLAGD
ncbi:GlcG/HbpS family heme-binding protein [Brevundimonas aurifodinae]